MLGSEVIHPCTNFHRTRLQQVVAYPVGLIGSISYLQFFVLHLLRLPQERCGKANSVPIFRPTARVMIDTMPCCGMPMHCINCIAKRGGFLRVAADFHLFQASNPTTPPLFSVFSLLFFFLCSCVIHIDSMAISDLCYSKHNGNVLRAGIEVACYKRNESSPFSSCCNPGDICLPNSICYTSNLVKGGTGFYMSSSTDPNYEATTCSPLCSESPL